MNFLARRKISKKFLVAISFNSLWIDNNLSVTYSENVKVNFLIETLFFKSLSKSEKLHEFYYKKNSLTFKLFVLSTSENFLTIFGPPVLLWTC